MTTTKELDQNKNNTMNKSLNIEDQAKENKPEELVEVMPVEGVPFTVIRKEKEYHIALGHYRLNKEPYLNKKLVEKGTFFRIVESADFFCSSNL